MASSPMNVVLRHLRRSGLCPAGGLTDGQLLQRFLAAGEQTAFAELVRRHGPMVLGVCRRILDHAQDAEDAFQATFLVLVRKASSLTARETVGNWLYGVAFRTAQKARAAAARRRAKEKRMSRPEALPEDVWRELRLVLDQELDRLPDKYREPIVLCDLEGATRKEAARRLGWPEGTLSGRLSRARVLLARRLARRGLTLSGGAVATALSAKAAPACVPAPLLGSTVRAAALVAAGNAAAGVVSAPVAALTEGVVKAMVLTRLKIATAVVLAVGLLGVGWGVYQGRAADPEAKPGVVQAPGANTPAPADKGGDDAKDEEKINLPTGPAPTQVLVSLDKDGKLVVKTAAKTFVGRGPAAPIGDKPGRVTVQSRTYDLDDVQVTDTKGKKIDRKKLEGLLKEEAVAVASLSGQPIDPLHLRLLKDGTLAFVLPAPKKAVLPAFGVKPVPVAPVPVPIAPANKLPATVTPIK